MLWLCAHFPRLSLEVFTRAVRDPGAMAVSDMARVPRVLDCSPAAARHGIAPGMAIGAARGLLLELRVRERDTAAEHAVLERLACWSLQFTSRASLAPPRAVLLEVGGSLRYFGGMDALLDKVRAGLRGLGFEARCTVAPTPLAAMWMAQAGGETVVMDRDALRGALADLPLTVLAPGRRDAETLAAMGLGCLGDCLRLPRDGLARRFGPALLDSMDRATGRTPDVWPRFQPPPRFATALELPAEVRSSEALGFAVRRMLLELAGFLRAHNGGAREIRLDLVYRQSPPTRIRLDLVKPVDAPAYLAALFRERLDRTVLSAPVRSLRLRVDHVVTLPAVTGDWVGGERPPAEDHALLIDRLRTRLGEHAVQGLAVVADHRPEHAWRPVMLPQGDAGAVVAGKTRPVWLLRRAMVLETRAGRPCFEGELRIESACERLEGGWWEARDVARDYFVACNPQGIRLWIYRELVGAGRWMMQGIFG